MFDFAAYKKVDEYGLFLHIANAHDQDKISITDRLQWVRDNHIKLMTVPSDNLYAERARLAYIEYKNTGETNIICRIDGTCSGIQLSSGFFKDAETGAAVNVGKSSPDDMPQDIYGLVAALALKMAKKGTEKNILLKYDRSITKKVIMILAYGAGEATLIRTVFEFLKEHKERTNNAKALTMLILGAIDKDFSAVTKLNRFLQIDLQDLQDERTNAGKQPLSEVSYSVSDMVIKLAPKSSRHLDLFGTKYTAKLEGEFVPDAEALARGLAPNVTHGADSELLRKSVNIIAGDVSCVHDDLGTHSCDVRRALQAVRTAYVEVIKSKPLKSLYTALGIPEAYDFIEEEQGTLKMIDVLESAYLFS